MISRKKTAHMIKIQWTLCRGFLPSVNLRATNLSVSSNNTTGIENFITVNHSSTVSGQTWNTVWKNTKLKINTYLHTMSKHSILLCLEKYLLSKFEKHFTSAFSYSTKCYKNIILWYLLLKSLQNVIMQLDALKLCDMMQLYS